MNKDSSEVLMNSVMAISVMRFKVEFIYDYEISKFDHDSKMISYGEWSRFIGGEINEAN